MLIKGTVDDLKSPINVKRIKDETVKKWGLDDYKLIISVTGGAKNFDVPPQLEKTFKRGLYKAAHTTSALIVSGGSNCGVMKWVGDALNDELFTDNIITLGIATHGALDQWEQIVNMIKLFNSLLK